MTCVPRARSVDPRAEISAGLRAAHQFLDRHGVALDVRSPAYSNLWLRSPDARLPVPDLRLWYREPGLWLPVSCAIARVTTSASASGAGTTRATPSFNAVAGNFVAAFVRWSGAGLALSSLVDTAGNTYTSAVDSATFGSSDTTFNPRVALYYAKNITGNATNVVTGTWGSSADFAWIEALQYSGIDTTAPLDVAIGARTASTTSDHSVGTLTTAQAVELILCGVSENAFSTFTAGSSFTLINGSLGDGTNTFGGVEEFITASTQTTFTAHVSGGGGGVHDGIVAAAFLGGAAGGGGVTLPQLERFIRGLERGLAQ